MEKFQSYKNFVNIFYLGVFSLLIAGLGFTLLNYFENIFTSTPVLKKIIPKNFIQNSSAILILDLLSVEYWYIRSIAKELLKLPLFEASLIVLFTIVHLIAVLLVNFITNTLVVTIFAGNHPINRAKSNMLYFSILTYFFEDFYTIIFKEVNDRSVALFYSVSLFSIFFLIKCFWFIFIKRELSKRFKVIVNKLARSQFLSSFKRASLLSIIEGLESIAIEVPTIEEAFSLVSSSLIFFTGKPFLINIIPSLGTIVIYLEILLGSTNLLGLVSFNPKEAYKANRFRSVEEDQDLEQGLEQSSSTSYQISCQKKNQRQREEKEEDQLSEISTQAPESLKSSNRDQRDHIDNRSIGLRALKAFNKLTELTEANLKLMQENQKLNSQNRLLDDKNKELNRLNDSLKNTLSDSQQLEENFIDQLARTTKEASRMEEDLKKLLETNNQLTLENQIQKEIIEKNKNLEGNWFGL